VLLAWAGMPDEAQYCLGEDGEIIETVISMHDEGLDFETIARYIDEFIGDGWDGDL
jgi:hypothetical protein